MSRINRREVGLGLGAAAGVSTFSPFAIAQSAGRVVIVGGGPGGATVANQLKQGDPNLVVTLIKVNKVYTTSFFSNLYLGGFRTYDSVYRARDVFGVRSAILVTQGYHLPRARSEFSRRLHDFQLHLGRLDNAPDHGS